MLTRDEAITEAIQAFYPRARRQAVVGIIHSGQNKTIYDCIVCGAQHSCATDYRKAKHVQAFKAEHQATCGTRLIGEGFGES